MSVEHKYRCDLCKAPEPGHGVPQMIGLRPETNGSGRRWRQVDREEVDQHICRGCLEELAAIWMGMGPKPAPVPTEEAMRRALEAIENPTGSITGGVPR